MVNATFEQAAPTVIYNGLSLAPMLLIIIIAGLMISILVSFTFMDKILRIPKIVGNTLWYTLLGGITFGVIGGLYYMFDVLSSIFFDATEGNIWVIAEYGLYATALFGGTTLTGYFVSMLINIGKKNYSKYVEKQYSEEADKILGSDEKRD